MNQRFNLKIMLDVVGLCTLRAAPKNLKLFLNNKNLKFSVNPRQFIGKILKELYDSLTKKEKRLHRITAW